MYLPILTYRDILTPLFSAESGSMEFKIIPPNFEITRKTRIQLQDSSVELPPGLPSFTRCMNIGYQYNNFINGATAMAARFSNSGVAVEYGFAGSIDVSVPYYNNVYKHFINEGSDPTKYPIDQPDIWLQFNNETTGGTTTALPAGTEIYSRVGPDYSLGIFLGVPLCVNNYGWTTTARS
jgi:hypothetical protein